MKFVLYNSSSGASESCEYAELLKKAEPGKVKAIDVSTIDNHEHALSGITPEDEIYIFGGDGTLYHFINGTKNMDLQNKIYYFPSGTGNDFYSDIKDSTSREYVELNDYLKGLPTVTVNGKTSYFLNGIGFGIDGYCCEMGDKEHAKGKKPNYTAIAIKGLLFFFKPKNATVTVDGVTKEYKKVWIAPTMFGRRYGGGMIPTPDQKRNSDELSLMVFHGSGKLKTLSIFPSIFKGEHVRATKHVDVIKGKEITVRFDKPSPLQIDGETVLNVTEYTAKI